MADFIDIGEAVSRAFREHPVIMRTLSTAGIYTAGNLISAVAIASGRPDLQNYIDAASVVGTGAYALWAVNDFPRGRRDVLRALILGAVGYGVVGETQDLMNNKIATDAMSKMNEIIPFNRVNDFYAKLGSLVAGPSYLVSRFRAGILRDRARAHAAMHAHH